MGDNLGSVDFGDAFVLRQLAVGGAFSCALSTNGTVKCWG